MSETSPRWSRATVILGTLTALFGLLAALAGAFGLSSSQAESTAVQNVQDVSGQLDAAQRKAAADQRTMESLRTTNNQLQGQIDGLEAELEVLRQSSPSASADSGAQADATVRRQGEITLVPRGAPIDLDAPASDPQWGRLQDDLGLDAELSNNSRSMYTGSKQVAQLGKGSPTLAECRAATAYSGSTLEWRDLEAGDGLCLITSDERFASMHITSLEDATATFQVVVYEK